MAKSCKYTVADGTVLSYDEMRAFMLDNYSKLNPTLVQEIKIEAAPPSPESPSKTEIKEDGFEVPSEVEMKDKREQLKKEYDDAIATLKSTFADLINQNLGFAYDPRIEAAKQFAFHRALVHAARTAIRLGINDVKVFAANLGKARVDKFTQRAWDDAERAESGRPMIINSTDDMLNATYQKVAESYDKQYKDAEAARKPWLDKVIENFHKGFFEADYVARKMLKDIGAFQALIDKTLVSGTSARAKVQYDNFQKKIFGGLSESEKKVLNNIIQAETIISIDTRFDAKGEKRIKHPGDTTMEEQKIYLGQMAADNPELYNKLDERAKLYFDAQRELLTERYKEGRISIDVYNSLIDNNYSPRVFLEYLLDESSNEAQQSKGSVKQSDIKGLSDGDVNSLFHDAEWLLKTNVLSTNRAIFHNRANRSLYDFAKANPNNGLIEIQQQVGVNSETGQPVYKDAPVGFRQLQFFDNGVRQSMLVPKDFYESWADSTPLMSPAFANAVRIGTGGVVKRMFATGINPVFALKNLPRDISHTLFFTNVYSKAFPVALGQLTVDLSKTFMDAFKMNAKDKNSRYYQYLTEGGGMDFLSIQGKPFEKESTVKTNFDKGVEALTNTLGFFNNRSEVWVRLAIREREINKATAKFMRDNGRKPNDTEMERIKRNATYASRSQMDFSRGGKLAKAVDNFIPYFNAGLQGLSVSSRYVRDNPKEFSIKFAQAAGLIAALTLYNLRYKEDDDIPEEEKARNFIFLLPYMVKKGDYQSRPYYRIPKIQSIQPLATMVEGITQWSATGEKPKKAGLSTLKNAIPTPDPRNMPIADALNLYDANYDRFLDKKVYLNEETTEDYAEYYINRTPHMWIDLGAALNMSPERLKEAVGKLTTDPDNNFYYTLMGQTYDALFKDLPEDEQKDFTDIMHEEMVKSLTPFQRSFMSYTNPNIKKKSTKEIEASYNTKLKLQNDTVNAIAKKYIKGDESELEVREEFNKWISTQNADSVDLDRLKTKFNYSLQYKDVDNTFWRMRSVQNQEARAAVFFYDWVQADETERNVLEFRAKELKLAPKDKSSKFWVEFERLKNNTSK